MTPDTNMVAAEGELPSCTPSKSAASSAPSSLPQWTQDGASGSPSPLACEKQAQLLDSPACSYILLRADGRSFLEEGGTPPQVPQC